MIEVKVKPTKVLYFNEDNYFGIYSCIVDEEDKAKVKLNKWHSISIKGVTPQLNLNMEYKVSIVEDTKSKYEASYNIELVHMDRPQSIAEQKAFLEAILTESQVLNIFDVYNEEHDVLEMIENNKFDYTKVKGIGKKTFSKLRNKVIENLGMAEVLIFLSKFNIKYNMIKKLVDEYENSSVALAKVQANPYLLTELRGIGFKTADEIAKKMKFDLTSPHRIDSCIRYIIDEESQNGHCWISRKTLLNRAIDYLEIDKGFVEERLDADIRGIISVDDRFTTKQIYETEKYIAARISELKTGRKLDINIDEYLDKYMEEKEIQLTSEQKEFFRNFSSHGVTLLIGYAGTGKSFLQKILLDIADELNYSVLLLSPTAKAAKVLGGYVGRNASTIHRRLKIKDDESKKVDPIYDDIIIVDESSMCDIFIIEKLLKAIENFNAKVVFIGDDAQIPSVSVGNFLHDCIHSGNVSTTKLTQVFRQKEGGVLDIATKIRKGESFLSYSDNGRIKFGKDCLFHLVEQEYMPDGYLHYYKKSLEQYNPSDICILSPTKNGKLGTAAINKQIQNIVNPEGENKKEKCFGRDDSIVYRVGDSVMNIVNTYDIEDIHGRTCMIANGDCGTVLNIDEENKEIIVQFEQNTVGISFESAPTNMIHSYALTIHKSQGSGFKIVICVIDRSATYQLNNNLLYTAVTRTQEFLLVLSQAKTINTGMKKWANIERRSFLKELL